MVGQFCQIDGLWKGLLPGSIILDEMAKDFDISTCPAENFIHISMIQVMLDRLY